MKLLSGIEVREKIDEQMKKTLQKTEIKPTLATIRVGDDYGSYYYEKSIIKKAENLGFNHKKVNLPETSSIGMVEAELEKLNEDKSINGILIFSPLPKHLDYKMLKSQIDINKDVDCINPLNEAKVYANNEPLFYPSTALAVMKLLEYYEINLASKNVLIIGRSTVVGKPLAMMCLAKNATVTIAHSKTKNLEKLSKNADIVIVAVGRTHFIDGKYVGNDKQIFIDVGINQLPDKTTVGDINFNDLKGKVAALTPVPRGIGSITTSLIFAQCLKEFD